MSLLDDALSHTREFKRKLQPKTPKAEGSDAEAVAIAWATGDIGLSQVAYAIKLGDGGACYVWLAMRLRDALQNGALQKTPKTFPVSEARTQKPATEQRGGRSAK
jgi:hypothetical protein